LVALYDRSPSGSIAAFARSRCSLAAIFGAATERWRDASQRPGEMAAGAMYRRARSPRSRSL